MTVTNSASAGPALAFTPTGLWPQVDLMPPEVRAGRRLKRTKRVLVLVLVAVLAVSAAGYAGALVSANSAAADLESAQQETTRLTAEQAKYAEVPKVLGDISQVETARRLGTTPEVLWTPYVNALRAVTPVGVSIDNLTVTGLDPLHQAPVAASVLAGPSIGTIRFTAKALTLIDTSDWLDALNGVPGLGDAWFSNEAIGDANGVTYYQVSATVELNSTALANRFAVTEGK